MKILGHPVHVMLIHFPSALFPMDLACAAIAFYTKDASFTNASFYVLCAGTIVGWLAVVTGAFDLIGIFEKKPGAMKKALVHGGINSTVVIIYSVLAFIQYKHYPALLPDNVLMLILKAGTIAFMIAGNFIGGSLILKHKVAVENDESKTI